MLALRPGLPDRSWALASGDFDLDGKPDLLSANFSASDVSLFRENASGQYVERSPSPLLVLEGPAFITTTAMVGGKLKPLDLNGDGRPDAVIVDHLAGALSVRLSDADLVLKAAANLLTGGLPQAVAAADFNGDSRIDLAVADEARNAIYVFSGKGDGNFTLLRTMDARDSGQKSGSESVGVYGIAAADFNRDGRMDLTVTQRKTDSLVILLGNGNGTFQSPSRLAVGRNPTHIQVVRLNDDQAAGPDDDFIDLAILLEGGRHDPKDTQETPLPGGAALLRGNGDGTFAVASTLLTDLADSPVQIAAGRIGLGQAGFDDLALVNIGTNRVLLYAADGNGGFATPPVALGGACLGGTGEGSPCSEDSQCPGGTCRIISSLHSPLGITLMDRSGDGIADRIAVNNTGRYSISFFDSRTCVGGSSAGSPCSEDAQCPGGGTCSRTCVGGPSAGSFCSEDSQCAVGGACVGTIPFAEDPASPLTATRDPVGLSTGALDVGNGEDLAVLSDGDPTLQTFSSMNDGFFFKRRSTPLPAGSGPSALTLYDLTRDLNPDAVVALADADGSGSGAGLAILRGTGSATFGFSSGLCSGGTSAGESCYADGDCPGGSCLYSLTHGACAAGTSALKACTTDADCPDGTCVFTAVIHSCSGGTDPGKTCSTDGDCGGGACAPWTPLSGVATSLLALDLSPGDADMDSVPDASDNCPAVYNPGQEDADSDGVGDACASTTLDPDKDLIVDHDDNCPSVYNNGQVDSDSNGVGDACDHAPDLVALEPGSARAEIFVGRMDTGFFPPLAVSLGTESAGIATGDFTSPDTLPDLAVTDRAAATLQILAGDGRGRFTLQASLPAGSRPGALAVLEANRNDLDLDGISNTADNCPTRYNPTQSDADMDGMGDACSQVEDPDGDLVVTRVEQRLDNCPDVYNHDQANTDGDRLGDACDLKPDAADPSDDNDLDGVPDFLDNCPSRYNPDQRDSSGNNVGDACDEEVDDEPDSGGGRDGILTARRIRDNCPDTYNPGQEDVDRDGIGDACENVQDVAVIDEATDTLEIFIQSPPGSWPGFTPIHLGDGKQPQGVVAVDLNQDSYADLVVSNGGDSTLSILMGQGDGTFAYKTCDNGGTVCGSNGDCPSGGTCRPDPSFSTVPLPGPVRDLRSGYFRREIVRNLPEVAGISQPLNNPVILSNVIDERADVDSSNRVDGRDLAIWARSFGLVRGNRGYGLTADVNLDGKIDGFDLAYIALQFGREIPPP